MTSLWPPALIPDLRDGGGGGFTMTGALFSLGKIAEVFYF